MTLNIGSDDAGRVKRAIEQFERDKKHGDQRPGGLNYPAAPGSGPADMTCQDCQHIRRITKGDPAAKCKRYIPKKTPTHPSEITIYPASLACFHFLKLDTDGES